MKMEEILEMMRFDEARTVDKFKRELWHARNK